MFNEILFVEGIIDNGNVGSDFLYRSVYMIAKYWNEKGYEFSDIREELFAWSNKFGYFLNFNVNAVIYAVKNDPHKLRGEFEIKISDKDLDRIFKVFDNRRTRIFALIMLCFGKLNKGEFFCPLPALGYWAGIHKANLSNRTMKELSDFGYITKVLEEVDYGWSGDKKYYKQNKYKLSVPISNHGDIIINTNDISKIEEIIDNFSKK